MWPPAGQGTIAQVAGAKAFTRVGRRQAQCELLSRRLALEGQGDAVIVVVSLPRGEGGRSRREIGKGLTVPKLFLGGCSAQSRMGLPKTMGASAGVDVRAAVEKLVFRGMLR